MSVRAVPVAVAFARPGIVLAHAGRLGAVERDRVEPVANGVVEDRLAAVCPDDFLLSDVGGVEDEADEVGGVGGPRGRAELEQPRQVLGPEQTSLLAAPRSEDQQPSTLGWKVPKGGEDQGTAQLPGGGRVEVDDVVEAVGDGDVLVLLDRGGEQPSDLIDHPFELRAVERSAE